MSPTGDGARGQLYRALHALGPYREQVILIGGWVPALYRDRPDLEWQGRVSMTTELDLLTVPPVPIRGTLGLAELLRSEGFAPEGDPRGSAHWIAKDDASAIEFLTPHRGTAGGVGQGTALAGQGGIALIGLHHANVLEQHARSMTLPPLPPRFPDAIVIRIPTLGAYVVNKGATFPLRRPLPDDRNPKQGKDLLYLRDVAAAGAKVLAEVRTDLVTIRTGPTRRARPISTAANNVALTANGVGECQIFLQLGSRAYP